MVSPPNANTKRSCCSTTSCASTAKCGPSNGAWRIAVDATGTSLLDIYGAGPVVASIVLGHVVDVTRFPSCAHFASYAGVAPIEASSGPKKRHRLNPRGNRQLNHALHIIAIAQIRHDTPGRVYYERKIAEGKTKKEAMRALKRRIADVVYRALVTDAHHS